MNQSETVFIGLFSALSYVIIKHPVVEFYFSDIYLPGGYYEFRVGCDPALSAGTPHRVNPVVEQSIVKIRTHHIYLRLHEFEYPFLRSLVNMGNPNLLCCALARYEHDIQNKPRYSITNNIYIFKVK